MKSVARMRLPTGRCNYSYPHLAKDATCGCQRFFLKKKSRKCVNLPHEREAVALAALGSAVHDEEDGDEDEEDCRCGHNSCYHSGHPTASEDDGYRLPHEARLQEPVELQRTDDGSVVMKLSVSTQADDAANVRTDKSAIATTLSAISGTTTERDSSTISMGNPMSVPRALWTTKAVAALTHSEASKTAAGQLQKAVSSGTEGMGLVSLARPPSVSSLSSIHDGAQIREKLKQLCELFISLRNENLSTRERLEIIEALPVGLLEELAEKVELMDDHVNEKVENCETRLKNEIDDRLAPIESFLKAQGEKRKRRNQTKGLTEGGENSSAVRDERRRKKSREERDSSEPFSSQQHSVTTTSFTASFTTTTSNLSSSATPMPHDESRLLAEIETLKARLLDVEESAPPSRSRPWTVEVVLIPPAPLNGVWADAGASIPNTQHTGSEVASAPFLARPEGKNTGSQPLGLAPLSFSNRSKVYKRLSSRGFIKYLSINGPTARDVSVSIENNFRKALDFCFLSTTSRVSSRVGSPVELQVSPPPITYSQRTTRDGTSNIWEPLRKIYRQVVLEYLSASDLTTPALWTVDFLKANCVKRGATRTTLYIIPKTPNHPTSSTFTWDSIKRLDPSYDEHESASQTDESCWDFDPKLDAKPHTGSFCSEDFASLGSFAPEAGSPVDPQFKISFSSHLTSEQQQEPTPPETIPRLQPRQMSKLNRAHTPQAQETVEDIPTDDDSESPALMKKRRSPKLAKRVNSAPLPQRRPTVSPRSPPLSYPRTAQPRRKTLPREPEVRVRQMNDQGRSPTPTIPDSPPPACSSPSAPESEPSFGELSTIGVGRWQTDSIGAMMQQEWEEVGEVTALVDGMEGSEIDWGSLFGSDDGIPTEEGVEPEEAMGEAGDEDADAQTGKLDRRF